MADIRRTVKTLQQLVCQLNDDDVSWTPRRHTHNHTHTFYFTSPTVCLPCVCVSFSSRK
jgi:hypothetical protein